ncbi:MAG TPA: hypothetical protein VKB72_10595 [Steroidobacteraceae bacterium]|nr:hypothetical protein [Steroidobacteraceae bacterium]
MHDQPTEETNRRAAATAPARQRSTTPSSSRSFASYLHSIEQLLDARRWEVALREARDLPRIAVALADPHLRGSSESVRTWCQEWIRPPGAERDAQGMQYERLARQISDRVAPLADAEPVPMRALRRLQLARNLRSRPQGFSPRVTADLAPREAEALETCTVLLEAARRWYARFAVHDRTTQTNLARLAVFR